MKLIAATLKMVNPSTKQIVGYYFEKVDNEIISNFIDPIKISDEESQILKAEVMFDSTILNDYLTVLISRRMRILIASLYDKHVEYKVETKVDGSKTIQTRYYRLK
jgi:hypothetical protein